MPFVSRCSASLSALAGDAHLVAGRREMRRDFLVHAVHVRGLVGGALGVRGRHGGICEFVSSCSVAWRGRERIGQWAGGVWQRVAEALKGGE
jgi:hypothetical protein